MTKTITTTISLEEDTENGIILKNSAVDFHKYWVFESVDRIKGGKVGWHDRVYIRNATVGTYLTKDLVLAPTPSDVFTVE